MSGLENFYRSKDVYITLPTKGIYYKQQPTLSADGELGIMPMTTRDEMLLKVPDTLYNGEALFEIIKSVAPDIVDPYETLIPDLDAILIATRIASYGEEMDVQAECPHCQKRTEYGINLTNILAGLKSTEPVTVEINGLTIEMRPNSVASITAKSIADSNSARLLVAMRENENNVDLYQAQFKESLERITAANLAVIADKITCITTPDKTQITDVQEIVNWLANVTSKTVEQINKVSAELNDSGITKKFNFTCSGEDCGKQFESGFEFNPAFFFSSN